MQLFQSPYAKYYAFAFKNEFLRPSHSSYHITPLFQTFKSKNTVTLRFTKKSLHTLVLDCDNNRDFCFQGLGTTLVDVESGVGLA